MRCVSLVLCFVLASWGGPAFAENPARGTRIGPRPWLDDGSNASVPSLEAAARLAQAGDDASGAASEVEARLAELETQSAAIDVRRPRFWTITGTVLTGVGLVVGVTAIVACLGSSEAGAGCSAEHWAGLGTTAALFTVGGVATLVPNSKKLRERTQERRQIDEEIRRLRAQRNEAGRARFRLGFDPRSKVVSLGWAY